MGETPATCRYGFPLGGPVVAASFGQSDCRRSGRRDAVGPCGAERGTDRKARGRDSTCTGKASANPRTPSAKGVGEFPQFAAVSGRDNYGDQGELQPQLHLGTQRKQNLQARVFLRV